ncbi:unnamed protein product [Urochloa decumbens]|uniref:Disease resistance protein RGA3 n=1 Tax=Urochloa decumbens TaxID=240449 RepID=A0ABC9BGD7_9POAL
MAESLLLPVVRGVVSKAADALVQSVTRMWGVDDDRSKLERHLVYVQSLLADAELKSDTDHAVRAWMKALKAVAYQADDILDNFQYEALRHKALSGQSLASKVLSNFTSKNRLIFRHKASRELKKVLEKIDVLVSEMKKFDLVVRAEALTQGLPRQTHSALDDSMEIFGRDDDKEVVVKLLLEKQDERGVQVLPIIGMGGVGKTTLAKMVYNNHRIQKHFELKMWHCVSENFEAIPLEAVGRKRFLLILDDVWNEDQHKWEDDLKPLLCSSIGGSGSMIVVTSRSRHVASIMGTLPSHELVCLSEDDSWKLFSKKAFSKGNQEQAELVRIGRRICNKCKGLPLALKTMGGLMSSKQQIQQWEAIADCNISDTNRGKDEVLPILKLSYKHLSPEMKQCFALCAVFPKDYEMEKDMLIQLWMANGYIHEEGTMDLAQKGEFVYKELVWRSFLQDVILLSTTHYFIYDEVSKHEQNCLKRMPPKLSLLHNLRTLTTFVVGTEDGCGIEELEGLQQLGNRLELYNLKKVKSGSKANLHQKQNLKELLLFWGRTYGEPKEKATIDEANNQEQVLESLVPHGELKILEVHGYGGLTISQWMRNPRMFQCLRELIMIHCPRCKDLPIVCLSSSLEHLSLCHMESLTTLCNNIDMEAEACSTSQQIFPMLKRMELVDLPELEIDSSVIFPQLEKLLIRNCDKLRNLPEIPVLTDLELSCFNTNDSLSMCMPLGCLSSLVRLQIQGMLVDVVMPSDGQQSQSQGPLDTLRYLWLEDDDSFISIFNRSTWELGLLDCLVLVEELVITACSNIIRWPVEELRCFPRLRTLRIVSCYKLEGNGSSSEEEEILPLPQLERLDIYNCGRLLQIPKLPASLVEIGILSNRSLVALPSNLGDLDKLRSLSVGTCDALKALPDGMDGLTSLEQLRIMECPGIEKFPQGLLQQLPALKRLCIKGCPDLQSRCREGGEYFDLVASIPE